MFSAYSVGLSICIWSKSLDPQIKMIIFIGMEMSIGTVECYDLSKMSYRSPVFRAMLSVGMKEQATGQIELKNMKLKTGQDLLYYLYNQRLKEDSDLVGLLAAADQYDLPELKAMCGKSLAATLTRADYAELLHLAELYDVPELKTAVSEYVRVHKS
jgi:hypothetical protein